ncbi:glycosyltransferase [bacterium]|nr:glycosyltransferase [bacterium]
MSDSESGAIFNLPLVSVVIPCLNRAHYLVPTIESVLRQDYPRIECIVVDGGSKDGTTGILEGYGDRIRWISEPDGGHADAINKGWRMSTGDILAWLNADDLYVLPGAVGGAAEFMRANPGVDVVYGDYMTIGDDGNVISDIIKPPRWDLVYAVKHCVPMITQPASFIRRSILEKVGWLDPEFRNGKDHELWLRIGRAGTIRYAPLLFAQVRRCKGLSQQSDMGEAKIAITEKFFSQPDLPYPFNSPRFRRRAVSNTYLISGVYTWVSTRSLRLSMRHVKKAIAADPFNTFYIIAVFKLWVLFYMLPVRWQEKIRKIRGLLKN